jgi:hypothetical protein
MPSASRIDQDDWMRFLEAAARQTKSGFRSWWHSLACAAPSELIFAEPFSPA